MAKPKYGAVVNYKKTYKGTSLGKRAITSKVISFRLFTSSSTSCYLFFTSALSFIFIHC